MRKPEPSEFLVLPIKDLDLIAIFRGSDVSRPLYVNYRDFIRIVTASISSASALLLQTNGTDNGSQTLLNLIEGSGITITDNGSGGVTISASGGGILLQTNSTDNASQSILNLTEGNGMTLLDLGGGVVSINGVAIRINGALSSNQKLLNLLAGTNITLTDTGFGNIFISASGGGGSGTVTSVGLSVPSPSSPAFSVSGSPVTTSGTLQINALGTAGQVIRGDGSLGTIAPNDAIYPTMTSIYLSDVNPLNIHVAGSINRLYLPAFSTSTIKIYDTSNNQLVATISLSGVQSVFRIVSNGELIATQLSSSGLTRYNALTGALIGSVAGGGTRGTDFIEYSATKLFITNSGSNNVSVYDPSTNAFSATIAGVGTFPFGICWNQNGSSLHNGLLIIAASNGVSIINPVTNTLVAGAVNPSGALSTPRGIAYDPVSDRYFVASEGGNKITILAPASASTFSFVQDIEGVINPRWIRYSALTQRMYVVFGGTTTAGSDGDTYVATIDPSVPEIVKISSTTSHNTTTSSVHNLALDDTNGYLYVNGYGGLASNNKATQLKIQP